MAAFKPDAGGTIHVVGTFFDESWCDGDDLDLDAEPLTPEAIAATATIDWCPACLAEAKNEGLLADG